MKKIEDIAYTNSGLDAHLLDLYLPDEKEFPVFIYFHGGGFKNGTKTDKNYNFHNNTAERGIAVISADYRLYPDAKFPDFIEDAASVVAWAQKNMSKYGKVTGYFIGGSSAGAYLAQMLCFNKQYLNQYGIDSDKINGYIFSSGQPTTHFSVLTERGIDPKRVVVDDAAPLYHIAEERPFSPMLIILASDDLPSRYEQTLLLISTLKQFGQTEKNIKLEIFPNSTHSSYLGLRESDGNYPLSKMIAEFITSII